MKCNLRILEITQPRFVHLLCATRRSSGRISTPARFRVAVGRGGKALTETQLKHLLRRGETSVIKGFVSAKTGKEYEDAREVDEGRVVPHFG